MRAEPNKDLEVEAESGGEGAGRAGMAEDLGIASWEEVEELSRTRLQRVLDRVRLWHLAAVLGVGLVGYLAVRGSDDYDAYKRWKARGLAVQGIQQARIRLSCRWLALRGERVVAERRLREVLGLGVRDAESELMLCALLLRPEGSNAGRVREAMERLSAVASEDSVAFESRSDAMKMEVRAYLEGPARPMLTPEVESRLLRELDVLGGECVA